jgi:hypothetical protein
MQGFILLSGFTLITNNKIHYGNLALAEALTILLGVGLWVIGLDVWRGSSRGRKIGGGSLLVVAALYTAGWLGLNYLFLESVIDWL